MSAEGHGLQEEGKKKKKGILYSAPTRRRQYPSHSRKYKLLAEAWLDYDVAMMLADRYNRYCQALFILQNMLGWATVGLSTYLSNVGGTDQQFLEIDRIYIERSLFGIALASSALIAIEVLTKARLQSAALCFCPQAR